MIPQDVRKDLYDALCSWDMGERVIADEEDSLQSVDELYVRGRAERAAKWLGSQPVVSITPAEFTRRMDLCAENDDPEQGHVDADDLMCEVLRQLGYGDGVTVYVAMTKWYA